MTPIPPPRPGPPRTSPFHTFAIGEDRFYLTPKPGEADRLTKVARAIGSKHGMKFASRKLTNVGVAGVRIWRIS